MTGELEGEGAHGDGQQGGQAQAENQGERGTLAEKLQEILKGY